MRHGTAIVLAIMLSMSWVDASRAATAEPEHQFRNPIEWLLSDIGKLLQSTTASLKPKSATGSAAVDQNTKEPVPNTAPAPLAEQSESETAAEAVETTSASNEAEAASGEFRNPISWLLSDLARILQPDLEIEQKVTVAQKQPAHTVADEKTPAPESTVAVATPVDAAAKPKNPILWLFQDLANLLSPKERQPTTQSVDTDVAAVSATDENAPSAASGNVDVNPLAQPAETEPAPIETAAADDASAPVETAGPARTRGSNPISWLLSDIAKLVSPRAADAPPATEITPTTAETAASVQSTVASNVETAETTRTTQIDNRKVIPETDLATRRQPLEVAPWVPRPLNDPFNPEDSLFTANGQPLLAAQPAPASTPPVETAAVAAPPKTPVIRERAPYRPLMRNHAAIGRDHKAVTPDPVEDSLVDRVLESLFGIDNPVEAEETLANKVSDRIVPEEKLDLGYVSPDASVKDQELTRIGGGPLNNIDLIMGRDSIIGAAYQASDYKAEACVERPLQGSVFCLKDLNWPAQIAASFANDTAFVLPGEGVVRYENGTVSRIYAVFKAGDFADVIKYMQHRFGPPQEREIGWMHMLEAPKLPNTTFRWKAFSADHTDAIVLEVRNYDDLRRSFADMDHGMVRLYRIGSRPIFKHISTMDLMLMQRRRLANVPIEVNQPPKQQ